MSSTDMRATLDALSPEQQEVLQAQLVQSGLDRTTFPVTIGQRAMLFLENLRPGNAGYLIGSLVRARGPLDRVALQAAVDDVVARHEALRTTFAMASGEPVQHAHRFLRVLIDDRSPSLSESEDELIERALRDPVDITSGPLVRIVAIRRCADDHLIAVAMHHLICDGWSMGIFVAELAAAYRAHTESTALPWSELPLHYGDFATWQHDNLGALQTDAAVAFWREHLRGAPAALTIPTDTPRPAVQGFRGGSVPFRFDRSTMAAVAALGRQHNATPFMVFLSAYAVLLSRLSGQVDVVIGVPTTGRSRPQLESVIGYFVTMLPLRVDLSDDPEFAVVIERVRDCAMRAYEHQDIPFECIVEALKPPPDLSRPPLVQTCFSFQGDPFPPMTVGGLVLERLSSPAPGARFDLEIQAFVADDELHGWVEFDQDLFADVTAAGFARCFEQVVAQGLAAPTTRAGDLALLSVAERAAMLALADGPPADWPERDLIGAEVHNAAARWPTAVALRAGTEVVTYAQFDTRVNRLANWLREAGCERGTLIGIVMERSVDLVVVLHAVLRAGGAFVPVPLGIPAQRTRATLDGTAFTLTDSVGAEQAAGAAASVFRVSDLDLAGQADSPPHVALEPGDLAYVLYTSGSTGAPKGVMNTHGGLRNRLLWMQDAYPLSVSDVVLQKTPYGFDVSVWEFFWPLMTGATLSVMAPGAHKDPREVISAIVRDGVTTVHFVPSMLRMFAAAATVGECTTLRDIICSGEALPRDLVDMVHDRLPATVHNLYGPTEAAIDVTAWTCGRDDPPGPVPIGRPIANTQVYVLDRNFEPVPRGVVGELHLGGANIAAGYRNRPDLTAERFRDDPFRDTATGRLYRTGDLARWRPDGALDYLGRVDGQVKVRGQRIELGEIEAVLCQHPAVDEAVVTVWERASLDTRLVAYVRGSASAVDLTGYLRSHLPEYMVPTTWQFVVAFPLNSNGKCDRSALPLPIETSAELSANQAPASDTERAIIDVYSGVLGGRRLGRDDGFFDAGGHSLLLVEAREQLAARLQRDLTLLDLFHFPTPALLAAHLASEPAPTPAGQADRRLARREVAGAAQRRRDLRKGETP